MSADGFGRRRQTGPVERSLELIEAVARLGTGATAKELATAVGMPAATCYRLLNSLAASEFLVRVDDLRGFALGRRVDELVNAATVPLVPAAARDILDELRSQIRFGVHLILYLGNTVRVADQDPDRPLRSEHDLLRHPHASAAGKLLLAHLPDWRTTAGHLRQLTEHTLVDPQRLDEDLDRIRADGIARQHQELSYTIACTATPIHNRHRDLVGAVCLAGPANRASALTEHDPATKNAATQLADLVS